MTLKQIKESVLSGKTVHWMNVGYRVIRDSIGQWHIAHDSGNAIGLTWRDGVTMNGEPSEFYIAE